MCVNVAHFISVFQHDDKISVDDKYCTYIFSGVRHRRNHPSLADQPIGILRSVDNRPPYLKSDRFVAAEVSGVREDDAFCEDHIVHHQCGSGDVNS